MILSIDTTAAFGSVALCDKDRVVEEVLLHAPDGFGHILFPRIEELLARHGVRVDAIDCFAAASGPGSFTGVRIGLTAAKGLAEVTGKLVAAVSNLRALASFGTAELRAVVLDARRGQVYAAVYDSALEVRLPEVVTRFPEWLATVPRENVEFVVQDSSPFADALAGSPVTFAPTALAGAIGRIAWRDLSEGRARSPAAIDANYVRRSDAELFWKE